MRLAAKASARAAKAGSRERYTHEALSAAMKLVVNSAYGYLGAAGLTRFSDVHAANEVTRRGRALRHSRPATSTGSSKQQSDKAPDC